MNTKDKKQDGKAPTRVFHIVTHFDMGGAERVALNIAKSETPDMEYHMVEVMRGRSTFTDQMLVEMQMAGVRCHRAFMPNIRFHFLFERLAALFFPLWFLPVYLRWRPDVIHLHTETPDMCLYAFFRLFPRIGKCRVVRTIHNTRLWTGQQQLAAKMEPYYQRLATNVAISTSVRDSYEKAFGQRLNIIYNGVPQKMQVDYRDVRPQRINVLFAGRFEEQKGIVHLAKLIRRMGTDQRYYFHIAGEGSLRGMVAEAVQAVSNATIIPPIFHLASYIGSFDYLFMPSEFEGLSMLSIEASMAGVPVVGNNCPGLSDTLPPKWPLLVKDNDLDAYEHLFRDLLPDTSRVMLSQVAREYAEQNFGIRRMQEAYEELYMAR